MCRVQWLRDYRTEEGFYILIYNATVFWGITCGAADLEVAGDGDGLSTGGGVHAA